MLSFVSPSFFILDSRRGAFSMIHSKVQMLKSAIESHLTVRVLQRKFNLADCSYRRLTSHDQDEIDPPKEEDATAKYGEETFQCSKLHCDENDDSFERVKIPRQGKKAQESNKELHLGGSASGRCSREEDQVCVPHENQKAHVITGLQNNSNFKTRQFQRSKSFCHKMLDTTPEVRKQQTSKMVEEERTPVDFDGFKSFSRGSSDPSLRVEKAKHTKTSQNKQLEFESEFFNDTQRLCEKEKHSSAGPVGKLLGAGDANKKEVERIFDESKLRQNKSVRKVDARNNCSGIRSRFGSSKTFKRGAKSQKLPFKSPGFRYRKLNENDNDNHEVKKKPRSMKSAQKEGQSAKPPLERVPSWRGSKVAKERLSQRRSAVCDNIEKQLRDQYGISLRNLRKCLVIDEVLRDYDLI